MTPQSHRVTRSAEEKRRERLAKALGMEAVPDCVSDVRLLRIPYYAPGPWPNDGRLPTAAGVLVTIGEEPDPDGLESLRRFVRQLKRARPAAPICFDVPKEIFPSTEGLVDLGLQAPPFVRAVFRGAFDRERYASCVTRYTRAEVRAWLEYVAPISTVADLGAVECAARLAVDPTWPVPGRPKDFQRMLKGLGLPLPKRWKMVGVALPAVLAMQREQWTVSEAAYRGAYGWPRAFRRHCTDLFLSPASTLRLGLGWEPLLCAFVRLEGRARGIAKAEERGVTR